MPRYLPHDRHQLELLPVDLSAQIIPGSFESTLDHLVDTSVDFSCFHERFNNDDTGRPAYHPAALLKIILYGYSQGLTSSRRLERACRQNLMFMALSGRCTPDHCTIAAFISNHRDLMIEVFRDVLYVADARGLIGGDLFAVDGCKLPGNASKTYSGTFEEFEHKIEKLEKAITHMVDRHQIQDQLPLSEDDEARHQQQIKTLEEEVTKYRQYMQEHQERIGEQGTPIKSNITDPDSAKIKTAKGTLQGFCGLTGVDHQSQIILAAQAKGVAQEQATLLPLLEAIRESLSSIGDEHYLNHATLTADSGFHSEKNLKALEEQNLDAIIADNLFRKRDPRFQGAEKYKLERPKAQRFLPKDFIHDEENKSCLCPAGQKLYLEHDNAKINGRLAIRYKGPKSACNECHLRAKCLKDINQKNTRTVTFFKDTPTSKPETATQRMKRRIDSDQGRARYSQRLGTVEPPFGHIQQMGFTRFRRRGQAKVNAEWQLICTVHNMKRIHACTVGG